MQDHTDLALELAKNAVYPFSGPLEREDAECRSVNEHPYMNLQITDHTTHSNHLARDMTVRMYGVTGLPVVVFPPQAGRFWDFENFGMVTVVEEAIARGFLRLFAVDSVDGESWAAFDRHPRDRAQRHEQYDRYICDELLSLIRTQCGKPMPRPLALGCSMGGYHAANFFFRHPDLFCGFISLSGVLDLRLFIGDYMDDLVYLNSPLVYLRNLTDPYYLAHIRRGKYVVCCGQGAWEEHMLRDARALATILNEKSLAGWVDIWGFDVNHDWPWWKKQLPYFLEKLGYVADGSLSSSS